MKVQMPIAASDDLVGTFTEIAFSFQAAQTLMITQKLY